MTAHIETTDHGLSAEGDGAAAHRTLLPFALAITGSSIAIQAVVLATGSHITAWIALLTALVGVGYAVYLLTAGRRLARVRYGLFTAHAITYAAINTGFLLHANLLIASGSPAVAGEGRLPIDGGWFGATFAMASFWGLGLLCHGIGAVLSRGFERERA
ncbi:2TM domain-containing protein [Brachybacterium squillarum]|uniref:2TM domain-containing protein n=1 Tax=Brachybacterium squillarum TaxID=661979 RepID=UPI0002629E29|nr:2TM domain-containing protein [Brachybacterium squillarum]